MSEQKMEKNSLIKKYVIGVAIIVLAVMIFVFLKSTKPEQPKVEVKQKVWPIHVMSVKVGKNAPVQTLYGTVESNALVTAAAPVSGVVETVWVKEGNEFSKGAQLAALSEADIDIPYKIAKADVADTDAQLKLQGLAYEANKKRLEHEKKVLKIKKLDVRRNEDLIKKDLVSKSALDSSREALERQEFAVVGAELSVQENKAKVEQLKARLEKAEANLIQAEVNRERGMVIAPYAGRVAKVDVAKGDRVAVNQALVSYYSFESLELRAKIPADQLRMIYWSVQHEVAISARFVVDKTVFELPLKRLAGESSTSGVDAFFEMPAELKITRPGDLLRVQLQGQEVEQSFAVPYSAVYGSGRIYQVQNNELKSTKVKLIGETLVNGEVWALVQGNVVSGAKVATTHLPNAISGLKVSITESPNG